MEKHTKDTIAFGPQGKPWNETVPQEGIQVTPPVKDPCEVYPEVPGISCRAFQLPAMGMDESDRKSALGEYQCYQDVQQQNYLGYQVNQKFNYSDDLSSVLNIALNNVGDPFISGNLTTNTKFAERAVLDYYASLWNAKWPHDKTDPESYWGYVLTMGSTEGNLFASWNARDYLSGRKLIVDENAKEKARKLSLEGQKVKPRIFKLVQANVPEDNENAYTPVAFFSQDTHYSIVKAMQALCIQTFYQVGTDKYACDNPLNPGREWPTEVPSKDGNEGPGHVDVDALEKLVEFFAAKGYPILVICNYGTTFKGAYDNVKEIGERLMPVFKKYGLDERKVHYDPNDPAKYDTRTGYWIHVDGALGAAYMPFVEMAYQQKKIDYHGPEFDFRLPWVHSIVMSGHKWIGAPWPCGLLMSKVKYQVTPPDDPEYIGSPDTTFAGSRSGTSSMIFWDYLSRWSYDKQIEKALYTEKMADYAVEKLQALEKKLGLDLWVDHTKMSLTIRFRQPNESLIFKYSLSCETLCVNGEERAYAHIFTMYHVTEALIDSLIKDLEAPDAFSKQDGKVCTETSGKDCKHSGGYRYSTGRGFQ